MELLIVIHHPHTPLRPVEELAVEVGGVYDRVMGMVGERQWLTTPHTAMILLRWRDVNLGWRHWHPNETGTLAVVGMPLLYGPPDGPSDMVRAEKLNRWILADDHGAAAELGFCGGAFAAGHMGHGGQVRLITNYFGEVPLYRAEGKRGLTVWATKAAAAALFAGLKPKLDQQAAREMVLLGHPLENRTLWQGVETEPPGTCILIDAGGVRWKSYLNLPGAYFAFRRPPQEIVYRVIRNMEPLMLTLRQSTAPSRLHLSGGLDSRAVAALCAHWKFRPLCVTHSAPNIEAPSARRVARFFKMKHETLSSQPPAPVDFFSQVPPALWQSDGMMSLKYLCGRYDLAMIRELRYLPIEGYGGEHGRGYYFPDHHAMHALNRGVYERLYEKLLGRRGELWPSAGTVDQLRGTVDGILERARDAGLDGCQAATWFYVSQRTRRWAVARRNTGWQWMVDPLQMPSWTYLAMSAEPKHQVDDGLMVMLLEAAREGAAFVPTALELAAAARRRRVASNRLVRAGFKLYDLARGRQVEHVQVRTLREIRHQLLELIVEAGGFLPEVISAADASRWLESQPWNHEQTELFWNTATLAAWCRQFLDNPPAIGCAALEDGDR